MQELRRLTQKKCYSPESIFLCILIFFCAILWLERFNQDRKYCEPALEYLKEV